MIREDRELMVELATVTRHVVEFTHGILGTDPVSADAQRQLGERLIITGLHLRDRANAGEVINGYLNGTVLPDTVIEAITDD